jgi:predicted flavoprotein YhiN
MLPNARSQRARRSISDPVKTIVKNVKCYLQKRIVVELCNQTLVKAQHLQKDRQLQIPSLIKKLHASPIQVHDPIIK